MKILGDVMLQNRTFLVHLPPNWVMGNNPRGHSRQRPSDEDESTHRQCGQLHDEGLHIV